MSRRPIGLNVNCTPGPNRFIPAERIPERYQDSLLYPQSDQRGDLRDAPPPFALICKLAQLPEGGAFSLLGWCVIYDGENRARLPEDIPAEHVAAQIKAYEDGKREKRARSERNREALRDLDAKRVAAGTCRHCGGPVPCWSPSGDAAPGVRNARKDGRRQKCEDKCGRYAEPGQRLCRQCEGLQEVPGQ